MKKSIKYGILSIAMISSFMLGSIVYAQGGEKKGNDDVVKGNNIQNEVKEKVNNLGVETQVSTQNKEQFREKLNGLVAEMKAARMEFKKELQDSKEAAKKEVELKKKNFKDSLTKIKDEQKRTRTENIVTNLEELNTKLTGQLSDKIDQIETVLLSIKSRMTKAEEKGLDVTSVKAQITLAEKAIADARDAIKVQAAKSYTTTITDEAKLKEEMQALRDTFKVDITLVREKVVGAHQAVRVTATTLAQIPKIDDIEVEEEVEDTTTTTTNQ